MALIFMQQHGDRNYQVRSAGSSKRLYTNGVFHSQWNAKRPLAGSVWDLLSLPVLYLPEATSSNLRVLLLGVGGGAVLRQLQILAPKASLHGVELDPMHLKLARDYFGVDAHCAELHHADARQWLSDYRGPAFDYVIDDLFSHHNGEPERAVAVNADWARELCRVTAKDGAVVVNFTCGKQLRESALTHMSHACAYQWEQPGYDNAIGVFLRGSGDARSWRAALQQHTQLNANQRRIAISALRRKIK